MAISLNKIILKTFIFHIFCTLIKSDIFLLRCVIVSEHEKKSKNSWHTLYILCIINKRELLVSPPMGPPTSRHDGLQKAINKASGHSWVMVGVSSAEMSGLYFRYTAERRRGDYKETMKRKMCHFVFFFSICGTTNLLK
jgi:hypothetical protein